MKVLIVNAFDAFAGSQRVAASLARSLSAEQGIDVQVHQGFGSRGFVSELPMSSSWSSLDVPRHRKLLYPIWLAWQNLICLWRVLRGHHLWLNTVYSIPAALLAIIVAPRKIVIHVHEAVFPSLFSRLLSWCSRKEVKIVCVSKYQRQLLELSCSVLYNSVEPSQALVNRGNRLIFVGAVTEAKGFDLFTAVAHSLNSLGLTPVAFVPEIKGPVAEQLAAKARSAGVTIYTGVTDPTQMFRDGFLTLQATNSRLWIETFSLVAAESIAHLVPVATAGSQVVAEVAEDALAFDHPSRDALAIANDIRALHADPLRYAKLVESCAIRRANFTTDAFRQGAIQILLTP
nr:hypothetical protein [uncultured Roseateles sp.]